MDDDDDDDEEEDGDDDNASEVLDGEAPAWLRSAASSVLGETFAMPEPMPASTAPAFAPAPAARTASARAL